MLENINGRDVQRNNVVSNGQVKLNWWKGKQVYGHHDKMARTKTQRTSQNTKYTNTVMCKHSLNTSLPLLKVSQVLKICFMVPAISIHVCIMNWKKAACVVMSFTMSTCFHFYSSVLVTIVF